MEKKIIDYEDLRKMQEELNRKYEEFAASFQNGQTVHFKPSLQSGKEVSLVATILENSDGKVSLHVHPNGTHFPESYCTTSYKKLKHYSGPPVKSPSAKTYTVFNGLPSFVECKTCGIDARPSSCKCYSWTREYEY